MKKIVVGTAITLALLLSGCGESEEEKGKIEFQNNIQIGGVSKAKNLAEEKFNKEIVEKWINELKEEGKFNEAFKQEENKGKGGRY